MATQSVRIGWRPYVNQTALLLDLFTSPVAAYSFRKLTNAYSGAALRIRRSNDNTEMDVSFKTDGTLNTEAMLNFTKWMFLRQILKLDPYKNLICSKGYPI